MSILKFFTNFLALFFVFGLTPFWSATVYIKVKVRAYVFPVIISSILNVIVFGFLFYLNHPGTFGPINAILTAASLSTGMILNLSAILQCCFHPSLYQNLIYQINKIEINFREIFSENLSSSSSLASGYRVKVLIIVSLAIVSGVLTIVMLWHFLDIDGIQIGVLQMISRCFTATILIHAILYVEIARMYLGALNFNIKNSPISLYSTRKVEFMKNIKLMHMDIWKFVTQINDFFSWSLLFFTVDFMINLVFDLYKIFRILQSDSSYVWTTGNWVGCQILLSASKSLNI